MAPRAVGALLAFVAALAFVVSVASSSWWSGHPVVEGHTITAKGVRVGLLGATGCNTGGDGSCEPVELSSGFQTAGLVEVGAIGLATLLAFMLAVSSWRIGDRRRGLAHATLVVVSLATVGGIGVLALGPAIHASQSVSVPIGWGTFVFGGAVASAIAGSLVARKLQPEPLRLKSSSMTALQMPPNVRDMLREQHDGLRPSQLGPEPMLGPGHAHTGTGPRASVPLIGGAPQLRPLYETEGYMPAPISPPLPVSPPTPLPQSVVDQLTGHSTPLPELSNHFPAVAPAPIPGTPRPRAPSAAPLPAPGRANTPSGGPMSPGGGPMSPGGGPMFRGDDPLVTTARGAGPMGSRPHTPSSGPMGARPHSPSGGPMSPSGGPMSPSGGPMSPSVGPMGARPHSPSGGPMSPSGGPMSPSGGPMGARPHSPSGGPMSPSVGPMSSSGGPLSPSGGPLSSSGGPLSPSGGLVSPAGAPMSPGGRPHSPSSAPMPPRVPNGGPTSPSGARPNSPSSAPMPGGARPNSPSSAPMPGGARPNSPSSAPMPGGARPHSPSAAQSPPGPRPSVPLPARPAAASPSRTSDPAVRKGVPTPPPTERTAVDEPPPRPSQRAMTELGTGDSQGMRATQGQGTGSNPSMRAARASSGDIGGRTSSTRAHAVPPPPNTENQPPPPVLPARGERASTETDDRLDKAMRPTDYVTAVEIDAEAKAAAAAHQPEITETNLRIQTEMPVTGQESALSAPPSARFGAPGRTGDEPSVQKPVTLELAAQTVLGEVDPFAGPRSTTIAVQNPIEDDSNVGKPRVTYELGAQTDVSAGGDNDPLAGDSAMRGAPMTEEMSVPRMTGEMARLAGEMSAEPLTDQLAAQQHDGSDVTDPSQPSATDVARRVADAAKGKTPTPTPIPTHAPRGAQHTPIPSQSVRGPAPISTAPANLAPPKSTQMAASGPTPACPQCEAPMAWVEEHLRFYCKQCRMYF